MTVEKSIAWFKKNWLMIALALGCSAAFVLLFSSSTSPSSYYYNGDETSPFLTVTKAWYFDILPYRDMYAPLGIIPYWIAKFGYIVSDGNKVGVIAPQILAWFLYFVWVYHISKKQNNHFLTVFLFITSILLLKTNYADGPHYEEFLLPLLAYTYSVIFLQEDAHPLHYTVIGGTLSLFFFSSLDAFLLVAVPVVLSFFFFKQRKKRFLYCLVGTIITLLPIYLFYHTAGIFSLYISQALLPQWNALFVQSVFPQMTSLVLQRYLLLNYPVVFLLLLSIVLFCTKKRGASCIALITAFLQVYLSLRSPLSSSFGLFFHAEMVLCIVYLLESLKIPQIVLSIACLIASAGAAYPLVDNVIPSAAYLSTIYFEYVDQGWEPLKEQIPSSDYDSVLFIGDSTMNNIYLLTNAMPAIPYFYQQDYYASHIPGYRESLQQSLIDSKTKWIIASHSTNSIQDILDANYEKVQSTERFDLYQIKVPSE